MKRVLLLTIPFLMLVKPSYSEESQSALDGKATSQYIGDYLPNKITTPFLYDRYLSPYVGAPDLLLAHRLLEKGEDVLMGRNESAPSESIGAGFARIFDLSFLWGPINALTYLTQRQVFGFGFRAREMKGFKQPHYTFKKKVDLYYTYGNVSERLSPSVTVNEFLLYSIGGLDATSLMADQIRLQWLQSGAVEGRQASLYTMCVFDVVASTYLAQPGQRFDLSNNTAIKEIEAYVELINQLYPSSPLSTNSLFNKSLINIADPFIWYGFYSELYYFVKGLPVEFPMIPFFFKSGYLPGFKLHLAPYGPEYYFQNYIRASDGNPFYLYVKWGSLGGDMHYGCGIQAPYALRGEHNSLGFTFDWFDQFEASDVPLSLEASKDAASSPSKYFYRGFASTLIATQEISQLPGSNLYLQIGYKTYGYLPGEVMDEGMIARGGFAFTF